MPFILDKTPVLLIIGLSGSVLSTAIPVPEFTEVTVPPPAGVAQTLSPLKKFKFVGTPVALNTAVKLTEPIDALDVKLIYVESTTLKPVTPEFYIVTLPVVLFKEIPVPAIVDNTPVFVIVIVFPASKTDIPEPLLRLISPDTKPVLSVSTIAELAPDALLESV